MARKSLSLIKTEHNALVADVVPAVLERLAETLTGRFGRSFSRRNLEKMRAFYLARENPQTPSALSATPLLPVPWSHDVRHLLAAPTKRIRRGPRT